MTSESLKNVVIVGLGSVGSPMLSEFVNNKDKFNVHLLTTRDPSDPSLAEYKNQGVTLLKGNLKDKASLVSALKGIDVVISTVGAAVLDDQTTLIDASIEAGVKRLYPSEFGCDTRHEKIKNEPVFASKVKVSDYLLAKAKEGKITYTLVINGAFPDWGWGNGFLGFDIKNRAATIYGDGNKRAAFTLLKDVARFVVASLLNPSVSENQILYVADFQVTQNEVLAEFEKATSTKWSVKTVSLEDVRNKYKEAFSKGDLQTGAINNLLAVIYGGNGDHQKLDNSKFPEVKPSTLSEAVKSVL